MDGLRLDEIDAPDALAIVVQGGLSPSTIADVAKNCRHWRHLFPHAHIVLSLSGSSVVTGTLSNGVLYNAALHSQHVGDAAMGDMLTAILASCDLIVCDASGQPLPPIKSDAPGPNNINLQIAAARNGLRYARGRYVLRTRADLVFEDRNFLSQYSRHALHPRGDAASLTQRVLISWLYTVNPFGNERLPLHFSDWFHFGLMEDVRRLWIAPPMTDADAAYYATHLHEPRANHMERLFLSRLAVEQHLMLHAFHDDPGGVVLAHHIDGTSTDRAISILVDNFVLCDLAAAHCRFPKYQHEFDNLLKVADCITPGDWLALTERRYTDPRVTLSHKIAASADPWLLQTVLTSRKTSDAAALLPASDCIASAAWGWLPPGRYKIFVEVEVHAGAGVMTAMAIAMIGRQVVVAEASIPFATDRPEFSFPLEFEVAVPGASDSKLMFRTPATGTLAIARVTLEFCDAELFLPRFIPSATSAGDSGQGIALGAFPPGPYVAAVDAPPARGGKAVLAVGPAGQLPTVARVIEAGNKLTLPFDVEAAGVEALELRLQLPAWQADRTAGVTVVRRPEPYDMRKPRFYGASLLSPGRGSIVNDEIVLDGRRGLLFYGPYATVPRGRYTATVHLSDVRGPGWFSLSVTAETGRCCLAQKTVFIVRKGARDVTLPFDAPEGATKLEIVCRVGRLRMIAVAGLSIARRLRARTTRVLPP